MHKTGILTIGIASVLVLIVLGIIFLSKQSPQTTNKPVTTVNNHPQSKSTGQQESQIASYSGNILAGNSSPLLDFTKADYDKAIASNKLVFLYFYANWCPICKEEVPNALYPAFNELATDQVIGFRVNFNDDETDSDETALARKFGVAYQHTKVAVKNGQRVLKSPETWNKNRYVTEIDKLTQN